jgi:hypothetical protein
MFVVFPKLSLFFHFDFILVFYVEDNVLIICLDLFVQGKLANLEGNFELCFYIGEEHFEVFLHFHISINIPHFDCIMSFVKNE